MSVLVWYCGRCLCRALLGVAALQPALWRCEEAAMCWVLFIAHCFGGQGHVIDQNGGDTEAIDLQEL